MEKIYKRYKPQHSDIKTQEIPKSSTKKRENPVKESNDKLDCNICHPKSGPFKSLYFKKLSIKPRVNTVSRLACALLIKSDYCLFFQA